jgi:predicted acyltransferase
MKKPLLLILTILLLISGNAIAQVSVSGKIVDEKGEGVPFDPEGLASAAPAIVQVIFGFLVGQYIQQKGKSFEMLSGLMMAGIILVCTGYFWDMVFPINKKIWTSSYVLYTSGLATLSLATLIYLIEIKVNKKYCHIRNL